MGASTPDIFGHAESATAATPETYGQAPRGFRLPPGTRLGPVRLQVADLGRSLKFYETVLGLRIVQQSQSRTSLAAAEDDTPLVELRERPGARAVPRRGSLGLYHFAILLPDRPSLGRFIRHLGQIGAPAGASDHLVSESLYLHDPDNLGIEVYADRPRTTWRRVGRELMMATDPLDIDSLLRAAGDVPWTAMPAGTGIGHVHLHVGNLEDAAAFYSDAIGFDRMVWHYPGALFLAAGGYHHHLGTNTWAGAGATGPSYQDAQMLEWTIELPDGASLSAAGESLSQAGYSAEWSAEKTQLVTRDPWGTQVRLVAHATAALP